MPNSGVSASAPSVGDVLQVREHEAVLEAVEEVARHALGGGQHGAREVVVGVEHDLEVPRREAVEHAVERRVGRRARA